MLCVAALCSVMNMYCISGSVPHSSNPSEDYRQASRRFRTGICLPKSSTAKTMFLMSISALFYREKHQYVLKTTHIFLRRKTASDFEACCQRRYPEVHFILRICHIFTSLFFFFFVHLKYQEFDVLITRQRCL